LHAFLNARAAGIVQANHGRARAHRELHDFGDFSGVRFGKRAAEDGEVLRENVGQTAVDTSKAANEAVAGRALLGHAEIGAMVLDEFVELLEGVFVEEQFDALARAELSFFVLALAAFGAAACFGFGASMREFVERIGGMFFRSHGRRASVPQRDEGSKRASGNILRGRENPRKATGGIYSQDNTMVARRRFGSDSDCCSRLVSDYSTNTERAAVAYIRRDNTMVARRRYRDDSD